MIKEFHGLNTGVICARRHHEPMIHKAIDIRRGEPIIAPVEPNKGPRAAQRMNACVRNSRHHPLLSHHRVRSDHGRGKKAYSDMKTQAHVLSDGLQFRTPAMQDIIERLSDQQLQWQPPNGANAIAWMLWHIPEVEGTGSEIGFADCPSGIRSARRSSQHRSVDFHRKRRCLTISIKCELSPNNDWRTRRRTHSTARFRKCFPNRIGHQPAHRFASHVAAQFIGHAVSWAFPNSSLLRVNNGRLVVQWVVMRIDHDAVDRRNGVRISPRDASLFETADQRGT